MPSTNFQMSLEKSLDEIINERTVNFFIFDICFNNPRMVLITSTVGEGDLKIVFPKNRDWYANFED